MVTVFYIKADCVVYILMRLPLISQCFINKWLVHQRVNSGWCTKRVNTYLVYQTRKHAVGTTGAVIRHWRYFEKWNHLYTASVIASIEP